jgi:hypothetical protein
MPLDYISEALNAMEKDIEQSPIPLVLKKKIYELGSECRLKGGLKSDCPFAMNSDSRVIWCAGYDNIKVKSLEVNSYTRKY